MATKGVAFKRDDSIIEKLATKPLVWIIFLSIVFTYPIYRSLNRSLPAELPILFKLQSFEFQTEQNEKINNAILNDRLSIIHFHDFSCKTAECDGKLRGLQKIQKRVRGLGTNMAIVSLNAAPEKVSLKDLYNVSRSYDSNPFVWKFVTAERAKLKEFANNSLKVPFMINEQGQNVYSDRMFLVDKKGNVRAFYGHDKESVDRMMIDVGLLINAAFSKS
ncbi:MAG: hypothetical protein ACPGJV_03380 [Bacteriovoracaceae bacterium]